MEPDQLLIRDYVLAAIKLGSSRSGVFRYKTKIHKILFILAQEFEELSWLRSDFIPYHFGPWSYEVEFEVQYQVRLGLLEEWVEKLDVIDGLKHVGYVYYYRLTRAGRVLAESAVKELSPAIKKRIKKLLKLTVWELIGYAYVRHPEYAARSAFADDELLPNRRLDSTSTRSDTTADNVSKLLHPWDDHPRTAHKSTLLRLSIDRSRSIFTAS